MPGYKNIKVKLLSTCFSEKLKANTVAEQETKYELELFGKLEISNLSCFEFTKIPSLHIDYVI